MDYLLRGATKSPQLLEDAARYGIILDIPEPAPYQLWAEHEPAFDLFVRCMTQWRTRGEQLLGLDYGVVLQLAQLYRVADVPRVMEEVQVLELHALQVLNARMKS